MSQLKAELCRRDFYYFLKEFVHITIPGNFVWNWHVELLCRKLQEYGEDILANKPYRYQYLIINVPPGSSKSTICSQYFPVWLWIRDPSRVIGTTSYSDAVSTMNSVYSRDVIRSDKFREMFPEVQIKSDFDNKTEYHTTMRGKRFATSTGGSATGVHADVWVVDDPLNVEQSVSKAERLKANRYLLQTLTTRRKDKERCPTIVVMQRLHEEDSTGVLLSTMPDECEHICLPAEISDNCTHPELYQDGLLDPIRISPAIIESQRKALGSYGYAGQFQQRPAPEDGGLLKRQYFQIIESAPRGTVDFYVDPAYTKDENNDPSAMIATATVSGNLYVLGAVAVRLEFPELVRQIMDFAQQYGYNPASTIWVENKASGKDLVATLKRQTNMNVREFVTPTKDKEARVKDVLPAIEAGRLYLIRAGWNSQFVDQCAAFPNDKHDDLVDCLSMAARKAFMNSGLKFF